MEINKSKVHIIFIYFRFKPISLYPIYYPSLSYIHPILYLLSSPSLKLALFTIPYILSFSLLYSPSTLPLVFPSLNLGLFTIPYILSFSLLYPPSTLPLFFLLSKTRSLYYTLYTILLSPISTLYFTPCLPLSKSRSLYYTLYTILLSPISTLYFNSCLPPL